MSGDDDQAWVDGLAGRGGDSPEARAAAELRRAIQSRVVEGVDVPRVSPAREAALLARARREGVLQHPPATAVSRFTAWIVRSPVRFALATVAGIALVVGLLVVQPVPDETVRGSEPAVTQVESEDPLTLRVAIVEALQDAGVSVQGYTSLDGQVVEATIPVPVPAEVRQVLARFDLAVPGNGELLVRITVRPQ